VINTIVGQVSTARTTTVSPGCPSVMHSVLLCSYMVTHCCLVCVIFVGVEDAWSGRNLLSCLILVLDFKADVLFVFLRRRKETKKDTII